MVVGYIVNRCKQISEEIMLETGFSSLIVKSGSLDLSSILNEVQEGALEDLFAKHIESAQDLIRMKKGVFIDITYELIGDNLFRCILHSREEEKSLFLNELFNTLGLSLRERETIEVINNALSFEQNFIVQEEEISDYISSTLSSALEKVEEILKSKIKDGVISSYSTNNHLVELTFPPSENLDSECKDSILDELSRILEENGVSGFERTLYENHLDQGTFYGVEQNEISFGIIISNTKGDVSILGAVVEAEIVHILGSLEMDPNTALNDSVINCDYIASNIEEISEGIEDYIYLYHN